SSLPNQIETVSDSFGRAFLRAIDAIWIISNGVVAGDVAYGRLETPLAMRKFSTTGRMIEPRVGISTV
ncbi:hypothetical protein AB9E34_34340, partial [Rhizobium leguminosarum]